MILTTTNEIPGKEFEIIGPVISSGAIMNIMIPGKVKAMNKYMEQINKDLEKAVEEAGGDAAVGIHYWSFKNDFFAVGTAVKIK